MSTVLCEPCGVRPLTEFSRVMPKVPLVLGGKVIAYVAVLRHRDCRECVAVTVRV